ncbi:MAG: T9SS type A sorting domain-containing protein [Flavobacteriales bacterium]|nr:T9SS type A sorting domain-containing protein [Flavobacteriales bacterium]
MKKQLFSIIILVALTIIVRANITYTICDGDWTDEAIWENGNTPVQDDSVFVLNNVTISGDLQLNDNHIEVNQESELCGLFNLDIDAGSKLIIDGRLKVQSISLSDSCIISSTGTIYTNSFMFDGLLKIDGSMAIGWSGECSEKIECTVGIEKHETIKPLITHYNNTVTIEGNGSVSIFNLTGQLVHQSRINGNASIPLARGIHLIRVTTESETTIKKVYLN